MSKAGLHDSKTTHRATWRIISTHGVSVNNGIRALVRALSVSNAVNKNRRRRRRVRPAIKDKSCFYFYDATIRCGMVSHPDLCWMAMNVSKEALFTTILHLYWTTGAHRQQGSVYLQADVFASAKRAANSTEYKANLFFREA